MTDNVQAVLFAYPKRQSLVSALTAVLNQNSDVRGRVIVVARRPNVEASTFPSEIVTCRIDGPREVTLFCKYATDQARYAYGHRGGVDYEAEVYRHVLQPSRVPAPRFYGVHKESEKKQTWLVIGYLENTTRVSRSPDPEAMLKAAQWLGRFHSSNEARLLRESIPSLIRYSADYYMGWARRAVRFAETLPYSLPWLPSLCARFEDLLPNLLASPATVIHGEFYPQNVLVYAGHPHPVDWESAAVAAGEIDLASLTDRWPENMMYACERAYQQSRWPSGTPPHFLKTLEVARIYIQLRWLGDWGEVSAKNCRWRFHQLHALGQRMGLI